LIVGVFCMWQPTISWITALLWLFRLVVPNAECNANATVRKGWGTVKWLHCPKTIIYFLLLLMECNYLQI
jgi:hypothetical protein